MIYLYFKNKNDKYHRLNGPAIYYNDNIYYLKNGKYKVKNDIDGPAEFLRNGMKLYYLNAK